MRAKPDASVACISHPFVITLPIRAKISKSHSYTHLVRSGVCGKPLPVPEGGSSIVALERRIAILYEWGCMNMVQLTSHKCSSERREEIAWLTNNFSMEAA